MKFNPTWQQVALLLGMIAAVIATHVYAAPAVGAVTSIVSTVVGALFVNLEKKEEAKPALSLVPPPKGSEDDKGGGQ